VLTTISDYEVKDGGAKLTITNVEITENSAESGGGIYLARGITEIYNSTILDNNADRGGGWELFFFFFL